MLAGRIFSTATGSWVIFTIAPSKELVAPSPKVTERPPMNGTGSIRGISLGWKLLPLRPVCMESHNRRKLFEIFLQSIPGPKVQCIDRSDETEIVP